MEEKMRRESKCYVEKLFKKFDKIGSGAIPKADMKTLVGIVVPEHMKIDEKELDELLAKHAKRNKHTVLNTKTKQLEVQYQDDTIDFPSCMAISVYFLTKFERRESNAFAGQGLIRFSDFGRQTSIHLDPSGQTKRLF